MVNVIRDDLGAIGVTFDNWFSERWLYQQGDYETPSQSCVKAATWPSAAAPCGLIRRLSVNDRDNVVVRSSGEPTYFASDIAYHFNKFDGRGFQRVIDIWGADHQGHVPRMKAAVSALGMEPENLTVLISQMVTLRRGDETCAHPNATGDFVTLRELVDEVGVDALPVFLPGSRRFHADGVRPGAGDSRIS